MPQQTNSILTKDSELKVTATLKNECFFNTDFIKA